MTRAMKTIVGIISAKPQFYKKCFSKIQISIFDLVDRTFSHRFLFFKFNPSALYSVHRFVSMPLMSSVLPSDSMHICPSLRDKHSTFRWSALRLVSLFHPGIRLFLFLSHPDICLYLFLSHPVIYLFLFLSLIQISVCFFFSPIQISVRFFLSLIQISVCFFFSYPDILLLLSLSSPQFSVLLSLRPNTCSFLTHPHTCSSVIVKRLFFGQLASPSPKLDCGESPRWSGTILPISSTIINSLVLDTVIE